MKATYQAPKATVLTLNPVEMLAASPTSITIVPPSGSDSGVDAKDSYSNGRGWNSSDWTDAE